MKQNVITADSLRSLLDYNPNTGDFWWRARSLTSQRENGWNSRHAGTLASTHKVKQGYIIIGITIAGKRIFYLAHRLAWLYVYGEWPTLDLDHINGDPADNRICNLREATDSQNKANIKAPSNNTSGVKGVYFDKEAKKWRDAYGKGMRTFSVGTFETIEEAAKARREAFDREYGGFAKH